MIDGAKVTMGGKEWIVPALNFKQIREFLPKLKTLDAVADSRVPSPENMAVTTELIAASMRRNYPEITDDDVADMLDLNNVHRVTLAVMGQSGFTAIANGDDAGE